MDPGTALGAVSLIWDVGKDIYAYYSAWKNCDDDVSKLRSQLLWLLQACIALRTALARPELDHQRRDEVHTALRACLDARRSLRDVLDKIAPDKEPPQKCLQRLKNSTRKAIYPLRKSTIEALVEDVESCTDAIKLSVQILDLDLHATTFTELRSLDTKLVDKFSSLGTEIATWHMDSTARIDTVISMLENLTLESTVMQGHILQAREEARCQAVLMSLDYPERDWRRHQVTDADPSTLQWLFEPVSEGNTDNWVAVSDKDESQAPPSIGSSLSVEAETSLSLAKWLINAGEPALESRVLWVHGKPGSGKSTFVKAICDHPETYNLLQTWAGPKQVIIVEHYFWTAGSFMQASYQAFLQHVLWSLVLPYPSIVLDVCTKRRLAQESAPWSVQELARCIHIAVERIPRAIFICIDGLDECQPTKDHPRLMSLLRAIARHSHVKLLVSSRPWDVFETSFADAAIKHPMEAINRCDIARMICSRLMEAGSQYFPQDLDYRDFISKHGYTLVIAYNDKCAELIQSVVRKADGVFLWVSLITDTLFERLQAGENLLNLRTHVDSFPHSLKEFFQRRIFERISETFRYSETAMILRLLIVQLRRRTWWSSEGDHQWLQYYWLIDQESNRGPGATPGSLYDPQFHTNMAFRLINPSEYYAMTRTTDQFLSSCAKDLLKFEIPKAATQVGLIPRHRVQVVHRTLYDYIQEPDMTALISKYVPEHFFDPHFGSHLEIAEAKCRFDDRDPITSIWSQCVNLESPCTGSLQRHGAPAEHPRCLGAYEEIVDRWVEVILKYFLDRETRDGYDRLHFHDLRFADFRGVVIIASRIWASGRGEKLQRLLTVLPGMSNSILRTYFMRDFVTPQMSVSRFLHPQVTSFDAELLFLHGANVNARLGRACLSAWTRLLADYETHHRTGGYLQCDKYGNLKYHDARIGHPIADLLLDWHSSIRAWIERGADLSAIVPYYDLDPSSLRPILRLHRAIDLLRLHESTTDHGIDEWTSLLDTYAKDEVRADFKRARQELVKDWHEIFLDYEDTNLMKELGRFEGTATPVYEPIFHLHKSSDGHMLEEAYASTIEHSEGECS